MKILVPRHKNTVQNSTKLTYLLNVFSNIFIDEIVLTPVDYMYSVIAVDVNGNTSEESESYNFCSPINGDANLDLIVNVVDIVNIVNMIFDESYESLSECIQNVVDVSDDGELNVVDVVQVVNIIFNILPSVQNNIGLSN